MSEESLRALIRLLSPLSTLREDLEQSLHLELFHGSGEAMARTFEGLRASAARSIDDPYIDALEAEFSQDMNDRDRIALIYVLTGQLLAYVQAEVGLSGPLVGRGRSTHLQTAPSIVVNASGADPETAQETMRLVQRALGAEEDVA